MLMPGAGRRTEAALVAVLALAISTASFAAEHGKADGTDSVSVSVSRKAGSTVHAKPQVASVATRSSQSLFAKAGIAPDPHFQNIAAPTEEEELLVDLVNNERTQHHLKPVKWDGTLSRLARSHAEDMHANAKMTHHSS